MNSQAYRLPTSQQETESTLEPPPLQAGDRLSRAEFQRRYLAHPEIKKAELIGGMVYMPSPVKHKRHGNPHHALVTWTGVYIASTPGLEGSDNATLQIDDENEPQPDILVRLEHELGGQSTINSQDYLEGAPELIVEVAASSANYDMHAKKPAYAAQGVQEYLLVLTYDRVIHWFTLQGGEYNELKPTENGILKSEVFPGLWLDTNAFWNGDLTTMLRVLQSGLKSPEHDNFVQGLTSK